jgi:hypothetical protein
MKVEEVEAPMGLPHPPYILRGGAPLSTQSHLSPSSCCSTFRASVWRSPAHLILHHHHVVMLLEFLGASSTSVVPLDRGNKGLHRVVCVPKRGSAASLKRLSS